MPKAKDIRATLVARIRDIDREIELLRSKQQGLEVALNIVDGASALVEAERGKKDYK